MAVDTSGPGYLAGEYPGGQTTVSGVPTEATVRVFYELPSGDWQLVATTTSATNGTWQVTNVNPAYTFHVAGEKSGFYGVVAYGVSPVPVNTVTYTHTFEPSEDFDGVQGEALVVGGFPPYSISVVSALPSGLYPIIDGRRLLIDGTTTFTGHSSGTVRVTASNGPHVDVVVPVATGLYAPTSLTAQYTTEMNLSWDNASVVDQGVYVYRDSASMDPESLPSPLATLASGAQSYSDTTTTPDELYFYRVATFFDGRIKLSDEVSAYAIPGDSYWGYVTDLMYFEDNLYNEKRGSSMTARTGLNYSAGHFGRAASMPASGGNGLFQLPADSNLNFSGDFTLEFFLNRFANSTRGVVVSGYHGSTSQHAYFESGNTSTYSVLVVGGSTLITASEAYWGMLLNTWHHVAVCREGNTIRVFIDGELKGSAASTALVRFSSALFCNYSTGHNIQSRSRIDSLRITNGIARYTANFAPPSTDFKNF